MPWRSARAISASSSRQTPSRSRRNCALFSSSAISQDLPALDVEIAVDQLGPQPVGLGLHALHAEPPQPLDHDLTFGGEVLGKHRASQAFEAVRPGGRQRSKSAVAQGDEQQQVACRARRCRLSIISSAVTVSTKSVITTIRLRRSRRPIRSMRPSV